VPAHQWNDATESSTAWQAAWFAFPLRAAGTIESNFAVVFRAAWNSCWSRFHVVTAAFAAGRTLEGRPSIGASRYSF
jgi:hypothetical protein